MLMQPSRLLPGKNLFHMMERAASIASIIGSIIAVLGAAIPGVVRILGVLFVFCNLGYASYVVGFYVFDEKKVKNLYQVVPDEGDRFNMSAWNSHVKLIDELDLVPADREQMVGEMKLLRAKVLVAMEKELGKETGEAEEAKAAGYSRVNDYVIGLPVSAQQQQPAPALEDARTSGGKLLSGTSLDPEAQRGQNVADERPRAPAEVPLSAADVASLEAELALAEADLSAAHTSASAFLDAATAEGVKKKAMKISWRAYKKAKAEEEELQAEVDRLKARLPVRPAMVREPTGGPPGEEERDHRGKGGGGRDRMGSFQQ
ncbi:hypothetical protein TeGR_g9941 [Tetraparma gracilis]|uniref:Uncharacterized protein n=1 Tax=Tetraparma gracilis TaxID=2962635 RepID=A0ABQ6MRS0_9STRA|nr:hypothetical protein TeGR_g9941 [Tetraparma gracilis]